MNHGLLVTALALLPLPAIASPAAAPDAVAVQAPVETAASTPSGRILGTGLRVSDLDRSIRFYTDILGMTVAGRLPHGSLTEVMLAFGGQMRGPSIILMKDSAPGKSPPIMKGDGFSKMVLDMPDLASVIARMKQAGMTVGEVRESMGVKVLFVTDPDGYRYELIERPMPKPVTPKG